MFTEAASKRHASQQGRGVNRDPTRLLPVDCGLGPSPKSLCAAGKVWERQGFRTSYPPARLGAMAAVQYNGSFLEAGQIFSAVRVSIFFP
jgi:hypothetical protein